MEKVKSKPGLIKEYQSSAPDIQKYFEHLRRLIENFPIDVALTYAFARVEWAHTRVLYCGIAKLHRAQADLTYRAVREHYMSRKEFRSKYKTVYGKPIPDSTCLLLTKAEAVRDRAIHGKNPSDDEIRNAIAHILRYAKAMNECTVSNGGPAPFGDLRGFKGAAQALEKETTRWVLKGMGFFGTEHKGDTHRPESD